ncbi:metallophosphoesterase [Nocardioides lianchengensis]|uniref:3',5'-cyclic AMP phosphodiesterase CpdA n=1 Tax=Nocardioides lianchengensis TaxID=1045774 RepID=A0A1G6PYN3_9ACTN|nr:metallophosphoesterase [Nocardioides lianchengensis]NYG12027.1 3',5'-cyclic AMP phosphodiesterase CpdA [Nocardioides lianchengensis]SDC85158.1 3',5'-cyclic AMP phosphodiesterase CpdA [Nocardioides lianchengensis]
MGHRILHLSDTHVSATGPDEDGVDALRALDGLLADLRDVAGIDLVLVTGDVADDGSEAGCSVVRERVGAFAAERGVPHVYTTGNHDDRTAFTAALGSGHLSPDGRDLAARSGPGCAAVSEVDGLRVVTLDSLVPGSVHGQLDDDQLTWVDDVLAAPAPGGTVVALHHPPIHVPGVPTMAAVALQQPERLAAVLAGRDVHAVLCGHFHHQLSGTLGDVPVWVTPGVVTRIDLTAPPPLVRAVLGAGASVIDLDGPASPVCHVLHARDQRAGEQVYVYDPVTGDVTTGP